MGGGTKPRLLRMVSGPSSFRTRAIAPSVLTEGNAVARSGSGRTGLWSGKNDAVKIEVALYKEPVELSAKRRDLLVGCCSFREQAQGVDAVIRLVERIDTQHTDRDEQHDDDGESREQLSSDAGVNASDGADHGVVRKAAHGTRTGVAVRVSIPRGSGAPPASPPVATGCSRGMVKVNVLPCPGSLSRRRLPPWSLDEASGDGKAQSVLGADGRCLLKLLKDPARPRSDTDSAVTTGPTTTPRPGYRWRSRRRDPLEG